MKECEFVDISCPKECGKQMKKRDLEQHLEKECPNRTVQCDYCKEDVIWNGVQVCAMLVPRAKALKKVSELTWDFFPVRFYLPFTKEQERFLIALTSLA